MLLASNERDTIERNKNPLTSSRLPAVNTTR